MTASVRSGGATARAHFSARSAGRAAAVALVLVASLGLAACDKTIRGAGQDIQDTGNAVSDAAN